METPEPKPLFEPQAAMPAPGRDAGLPEDVRVPWNWADVVLFVLFGVGSLVVMGPVAALAVFVVFRATPATLDQMPTAKAAFVTLSQALWSGVMLLYLLAVIRLRFGAPFWRTLGWRPLHWAGVGRVQAHLVCLLGGSLFAICMQILSATLRPETPFPIENLFRNRESVFMLMAMGIAVAPLVEETIFRGYLYPVLARRLGIGGGVVVTGALFALMHGGQLGWSAAHVGLLGVVGIVFTYARARAGTVLAPYLLHLGYNAILFLSFYVGTDGLRNLPPVR